MGQVVAHLSPFTHAKRVGIGGATLEIYVKQTNPLKIETNSKQT